MNKLNRTIICLDMAGCPNRCKHCWLGLKPNGNMKKEELIVTANAFRPYTEQLEISSWYREPDFRYDYKELWNLECMLSDSKMPHFELISYWRLARDEKYAKWLYSLGVRACQLTLFGSEEITDYYVGRKGAYKEIINSIDILLEQGIAPRLQVFVNKHNINELSFIEDMVSKMDLINRCKALEQDFDLFIHQGSCDGENEKLYDIRVTNDDLAKIPDSLKYLTLNNIGLNSLNEIFGQPENILIKELLEDKTMKTIISDTPVFYIDGCFDVYPNITQPSKWWCLGNLKTDGAENVIHNYLTNKSIAQDFITTVTIAEMVKLCGSSDSERLFTKGDYITYIQNQYCKLKH